MIIDLTRLYRQISLTAQIRLIAGHHRNIDGLEGRKYKNSSNKLSSQPPPTQLPGWAGGRAGGGQIGVQVLGTQVIKSDTAVNIAISRHCIIFAVRLVLPSSHCRLTGSKVGLYLGYNKEALLYLL